MAEREPTAGWPNRSPEASRQALDIAWEEGDAADASGSAGRSLQELLWAWIGELRRRRWLALLMFVVGLAPMVALALLSIPTYTSTGVVQVSSTGSMLSVNPLLELAGAGANANVETEIELMRRREFLLEVFKDLGLHIVDPHQRGDMTLDLAVSLRGASPVSSAVVAAREAVALAAVAPDHAGDVRLRLTASDESTLQVELGEDGQGGVHTLTIGERLATPALILEFTRLPVAVGESVDLVVRSDGALYDDLQSALSVRSIGGRSNPTNLVRVAFTATDRRVAQAVVTRLMQRYVEQSLEWQTASASRAVEFISSQLIDATDRLAEQEDALRTFAEDEGAVQLDIQARTTIESVAALEAERLKAALQERQMDHVLGGMKGGLDQGKVHLTANFFDDPVLAANIAALTENEVRYELLKASLAPEHPQVVELAAQLRLQQQEVRRLMRSARRNLAARTGELERQLESASAALEKYPDKQLRMARLMRAVAVSERLYSFLLEKANEAEILEASTTTDKRVVDAASFPHRKTAPQRGRMLGLGVVAGLLAAFGAVWLARTLQRTLGSVEAITGLVPWPLYGTLPALVPAPRDAAGVLAATWQQGPTATAEASRSLAVNVSMIPAARGRIVQFTSSRPGEGKSTSCANLAAALARTGARVLLVDLDLRKPSQHRIWRVPRAPGLVDLITKPSDPESARQVMHRDETYGVTVLTAGTQAVDTTAILMTEQLAAMLAAWSDEFDHVLLDCPPAFVPDTAVVARHADLLLLVARPGVVERGEVRHALTLLARVPAGKGLLLSAVKPQHLGFGQAGSGDYYTYGLARADGEPRSGP